MSTPKNQWMIVSMVLAALLAIVIIADVYYLFTHRNVGGITILPAETAAANAMGLINTVVGPQVEKVEYKGVADANGLYNITFSITNQGQSVEEHGAVTKDGKIFLPQLVDIDQELTNFKAQLQAVPQDQGALSPTAPADPASTPDTNTRQ